ncbi:TPA: reactive intermediate/imine deaminase [Candidatus Acetothermia bacterium]|nr:reactive intermediate/imine deaminase [Candidatus Acetothermia bacterium]
MSRRTVTPPGAPVYGPYSPAVQAGPFLFVSGQLPALPSGELLSGPIEDQARLCMENIAGILRAAQGTLGDLVKVTIYLADMRDFGTVNSVYAMFFDRDPPARACVEVARLPKDARIEIEAVAYLGGA